jgi:diguanylate cyclase (GGDEF)-like protein/hemerythrin-like metal-binding protein
MSGRLLVLDDDATIAATVAMIAESAGFEAVATTTPEEFFRVLEAWRPSHIALDLVMPEMDGVQVMTHLAALRCRAGIIITSGVGSRVLDAARRSAAEHGLRIVGTLPKPFTPAGLRALLLDSAPGTPTAADTGVHRLVPARPSDSEVGADELARAVAEQELFLVYQPQVDCGSGEVSGFEALVRWRHPRLGNVMPDRFIPIAERSGLIDVVTDRVVDLGLAWLSQAFPSHRAAAPSEGVQEAHEVTLSINMSAASLGDRDFVDHLTAACARYGVEPERIIMEMTETSAMRDPVATLDQLTRMRMKGFQLSIDDFGTGFSSMLQLARLPFSELKVDKSFVMRAMQSMESRAVVRSVVELGRSFGLRTVAEGVEDAGTLEYLKGLGCELAQGYYIGRPMTDKDVTDWLARCPAGTADAPHDPAPERQPDAAVSFCWDQGYITGLDEVDRQHKRLVELINRFGDSLLEGAGVARSDLETMFSELVDYTNYHFSEEEAMMGAAGLDEGYIRSHRTEHANFIAELVQLREHADPERPESLHQAMGFLVHWLAYHILGVDQGMARQVAAIREGVPPAEAAERERQGSTGGREPLVNALIGLFQLLSQRNRQLREANRMLEERIFERTEALSQANSQLAAIAMTDPLTGIANRRHALAVLNREWASGPAGSRPLACLMIDADHLKPVNDTHGHEAGDEVLRALATRLQDAVRSDDVVCRLGGDEFLAILPSTDLAGASQVAENILRAVARLRVVVGETAWHGSVCIGIAVRDDAMDAPEQLIKASDKAVYAAKRAGRGTAATRPAAG